MFVKNGLLMKNTWLQIQDVVSLSGFWISLRIGLGKDVKRAAF